MKAEPNAATDLVAFLTRPEWPTWVFWALLIASCAVAITAWRRDPGQRSPRHVAIWLARLTMGVMWWQGSLWKIPPNYDGLVYWMKQIVAHAAVPVQGWLVDRIVLPYIGLFGPAVYLTEAAIAVSFLLGFFTRGGALLGLAMALNLWLGLYSAPNEWPWTYGFLIIIQALFVVDPPGRSLGLDARPGRY